MNKAVSRRTRGLEIHRTQFIRPSSTPNEAGIGFRGLVSRIVREHHYGLRARVNKKIRVQMEERQLLGFMKEELQTVGGLMIQHLAKR